MNQDTKIIKYPKNTALRKPSSEYPQQGFRIRHYIIGQQIGKGAFSIVFKAHHVISTQAFAIKVVSLQNANPNIITLIKTEIEISRLLNHQNIIKVFQAFQDNNYFYFVMEFVKGKQLYSIIRDESRISEPRAVKILCQLLLAVRYLHKMGIAHRDIKAQNILIDEQNNIKLIDFGLSKKFGRQPGLMETFCGSLPYLAPEMLKKKGYNGQSVDMWCIGVILFFMLQGKFPFGRQEDEFLEQNIKNNIWSSNYSSEEAIQTYRLIFRRQQQRPTIKQLMNCRLLKKYQGKRSNIYTTLDSQKEERRRYLTLESDEKYILKKKKSFQEIQFELKLSNNLNLNLIKQLSKRKRTIAPQLYKPHSNRKNSQISTGEWQEKIKKYQSSRNKTAQKQQKQQFGPKQDQLSLSSQAQISMIEKLFAKKNKQMINFHRDLYNLGTKLSMHEAKEQNQTDSMLKIPKQKFLYPSYYSKLRNLKIVTERDRAFLKEPQETSFRSKRI